MTGSSLSAHHGTRAPAHGARSVTASLLALAGRRLAGDRLVLVAAAILTTLTIAAVCAPLLAPFRPTDINLDAHLNAPLSASTDGRVHLFGTDGLGRDVFTRVMYGGRVSLLIGFATVVIAGLLGLVFGVLAGYLGGWVDATVTGVMDLFLAFPFILLAMAVVAVVGPGVRNIILVLGCAGWMVPARVARAEARSLREREFVMAAYAAGAGPGRMIVRHIIPNILSSTIVVASFLVAQMIIVESALGFIGLGVPPPTPSWGTMIADGQNYLQSAWWISFGPGLALMLTVLSINVIGDFLRDILDPRLRV